MKNLLFSVDLKEIRKFRVIKYSPLLIQTCLIKDYEIIEQSFAIKNSTYH